MKKIIYEYKYIQKELDVSEEDIINEVSIRLDDDSETLKLYDFDELPSYIDDLLSDDYYILSPDEEDNIRNKLIPLIESKYNELMDQQRNAELDLLRNRTSIIFSIAGLLDELSFHYPRVSGDLGYSLSAEEIVDLIIQNGNKE